MIASGKCNNAFLAGEDLADFKNKKEPFRTCCEEGLWKW
jgi:hypothetical protein